MSCPFCKSENILVNQAKTIFCYSCYYSVTRHGNISRLRENPYYKQYGWKIKRPQKDWFNFTEKKFSKKKLRCWAKTDYIYGWERNR
jgi:hypothetical protein